MPSGERVYGNATPDKKRNAVAVPDTDEPYGETKTNKYGEALLLDG
jgi:hypothetical protein